MQNRIIRLFLVFVIIFNSCQKKNQEDDQKDENRPLLSIVESHNSLEKVLPNFQEEVDNWQQHKNIEAFLERFKKASANEVLSNALELKVLSKSFQDSIKPELFILPSVDARINIFRNETLRLADMTYIPAITPKEVHAQTNKIIDAFSSINSKINTVLRKKQFEEAIDVDVSFIGLDTTKLDSVSRKAVNLIKEEKQPKKPKIPKLNKRQQ